MPNGSLIVQLRYPCASQLTGKVADADDAEWRLIRRRTAVLWRFSRLHELSWLECDCHIEHL